MHFIKEDLAGNFYNWTSRNTYNGSPSRRLFNKTDGNQVLFIINFIGSLSEKFSKKEGLLIEEMIIHHLPTEVKSEMSVYNWLSSSY